jgi:hypothetical protein
MQGFSITTEVKAEESTAKHITKFTSFYLLLSFSLSVPLFLSLYQLGGNAKLITRNQRTTSLLLLTAIPSSFYLSARAT